MYSLYGEVHNTFRRRSDSSVWDRRKDNKIAQPTRCIDISGESIPG